MMSVLTAKLTVAEAKLTRLIAEVMVDINI